MTQHFSARSFLPLLGLGLLGTFSCTKETPTPTASLNASTTQQDAQASAGFVLRAKQYIIIASGDQLPGNIEALTTAANGKVTSHLQEVGLAIATSDDPDFATKAAKISGVRSVVHDFTYQGFEPQQSRVAEQASDNVNPSSTGDSNPLFPLQWGATAIQAPEAWNTGNQGQGVLVADLDGGFELNHPDLKPNILGSMSFVPGESAQFAGGSLAFSHGTHTAGTIAAVDNNIGVIGIAPQAKLLLVKVLGDAGSGSFSWLIQGIVYATQQHADVINMSLGAAIPHHDKYIDDAGNVVNDTKAIQELLVALSKATSYATKNGVTLIAAAGNDANNGNQDKSLVNIPADATGVISISATAPIGWALAPLTANLDRFASYSNYGTPAVTFAAPGGDFAYPGNEIVIFRGVRQYVWALDMVLSTGRVLKVNGVPRAYYTWAAGTSMATPHATGVAALIIGKNGGNMDPARVEAALRASADDLGKPGRDPYYGYGRVNAYRAVAQPN
ncbi:S8 family serine peptidase [Hymenobacter ginsengisoli]|uniref:S8 family serine peptidase n=1 Tax=Hymenobacter ginsengisoli TaxID=1051626 RepID=A0ABP8QBG8_9BACT|nr:MULTISPECIES: S8 family serine peptidase [unclassified Hymenobacter]MBO2030823.1 S8 family serine peptidase [Hymenobacter sp. BT559]